MQDETLARFIRSQIICDSAHIQGQCRKQSTYLYHSSTRLKTVKTRNSNIYYHINTLEFVK